ncbi:MAG: class I SAM-dependent methyltransferase [Alphaproteobacteria bacterium]
MPILDPSHFAREDESPDPAFYDTPRLVAHIDDAARAALTAYFTAALPANGVLLDLMASYHSHLPEGNDRGVAFGLGLNGHEMAANAQLAASVVHDVNAIPELPFCDAAFDACILSVSVQYAIRPIELFRSVARVLKPGAPFLVVYANRLFPTKAVALWRGLSMMDRGRLVALYLREAGGFSEIATLEIMTNRMEGDDVRIARGTRQI